MYVHIKGAKKRLTIELPFDQYDFLQRKALAEGTTVSGLIRGLIDECRSRNRKSARKDHKVDPFYKPAWFV